LEQDFSFRQDAHLCAFTAFRNCQLSGMTSSL